MSASVPPIPRPADVFGTPAAVSTPGGIALAGVAATGASARRHEARVAVFLAATLAVLFLTVRWVADVVTPGSLFVVSLLALVPLSICWFGLRWVDRWDPEPWPPLAAALTWGAGASIAGTLLIGDPFARIVMPLTSMSDPDLFGAVVQAPIVEELCKGLGIVLIFLLARWQFDGPVDGVVYGGLVGAGFAFTENLLYLASALAEAPGVLVETFLLRGVFSPFAHVSFSIFMGAALGLANVRGRRRWPLYLAGGYALAVAGHLLWNGGLAIGFDSFLSFYLTLQVPLFLILIGLVLWLRRLERSRIGERLSQFAGAGWLDPAEVAAFATPEGRRQAKRWGRGSGRAAEVDRLTRTAVRLAEVRQRIECGNHDVRLIERQEQLLRRLVGDREAVLATPRP
ncbi:PrsW family intramembrane metalloprotease [Zhihengliuella sp.]|uniref:PrsW family intramembrane metalloprotease n=1 Tax=Zhihengliuella sp. TaxID=1954483 RepID=UPI0028126838|nr:PrsW family intramembrane metalloprotease [Zhihengliuella sp.]